MAAELRWILFGLSLPLLAGIWWWTARRTRQAPGNAELREPTPPPLDPRPADAGDDDWGISPFEPLNIHTADFDGVPVLDGPMMVSAEPVRAPAPGGVAKPLSRPAPVMPAAAQAPPMRPVSVTGPVSEHSDRLATSDRFATVAPPAPNATEQQRIVTIRVCAVGETRWSGAQLMEALELHGLAFGRYQVFHRKHSDGRSLFCVASLIEPGIFDIAQMADQEFRGVTLFAVLPGPLQPLETMDELLGTARGLARQMSGMVQDGRGVPLSPQRAAALREDIARFQASLTGN